MNFDPPPSWRASAKRPRATPTPTVHEGQDWRTDKAISPRSFRRVKLILAGMGVLLLTGALFWAGTWLRPPKPAQLVLIGAGYHDNLLIPPNVYGWQGLQDLAAWTGQSRDNSFWRHRQLALAGEPVQYRREDPWDTALEEFDGHTLVLFLALHGGADEEGAYLLPQDATATKDKKNRLRLTKVLDRLAELPAHTRKLLVLDATQVSVHWPLGMLTNEFARSLKDLDERIQEIPRLVVFCASDVDQISWSSPEWRQTAFAHYFLEAIKGLAWTRENEGRLSAWDVFVTVRKYVQRWSMENRGAVQQPILLPGGSLGEKRAKELDLAVVSQGYEPPNPHETPVFTPSSQLMAAWQHHQELAQQKPSAEVYAPQIWRQYQDTLLRYGDLLSAGAAEWANQLLAELRDREEEVAQLRQVDLQSATLSFAMPEASGWLAAPENLAVQVAQDLLSAPSAQMAKRWESWVNKAEAQNVSRQQLRLIVMREFYRRVKEDPSRSIDPVCALYRQLENPLQPRPTEINFLLLLQRDLPPRPMSGDLATLTSLALSVHALSEQAALGVQASGQPYCETVSPWVVDLVAQGDEHRRMGEDMLFADASYYPKATEHLQQAKMYYDRAVNKAEVVRSGLLLRDRVLAQLPYYSRWVARTSSRSSQAWLQGENLVDEVETLWKNIHELANLLSPTTPDRHMAVIEQITAQHKIVESAFARLQEQFSSGMQNLVSVNVPSLWKDAGDVLVVPFDDAPLRMKLRSKQRQATRRLLIETEGLRVHLLEPTDPVTERQNRARREGRLALAQLGESTFALPTQSEETFEQVKHRLGVFEVEEQWWKSLTVAGTQLAERRLLLAETVTKDLSKLLEMERATAKTILRRDDLLVRQIDGANQLKFSRPPVPTNRRLLLQDLLVRQANRTWGDHWASDRTDRTPYYRTSGLTYVGDAEQISFWPDVVTSVKTELKLPGDVEGTGPAILQLTDGHEVSLQYMLGAPKGGKVPPGRPVVWLQTGASLALTTPMADKRSIRVLDKDGAVTQPVKCTLNSPALAKVEANPVLKPKTEATNVILHGLYRGQQFTTTTPVELYYAPDRVRTVMPMPNRASVSVRASNELHQEYGEGNGGIAIVLDCSGSMGPAQGQPFTASTKYAEALKALREVLAKIPKGTTVSLWTFGQAVGDAKTVTDAEKTVQRVLAPTTWDPENTEQLAELMQSISYPKLEPWNESPILRALLEAKADLRTVQGLKTLLVLTDGMDNRYQKDPTLDAKGKTIGGILREEFRNSAILVNVVGFKVVDAEEKLAEQQWKTVQTLSPPGNFYTVEDGEALASILAGALRQRLRFWVEDYDNQRLPHELRGIDIARGTLSDAWYPGGIAPGGYKVRAFTNTPIESGITLGRGDLLPLQLKSTPTGVQFERYLYSEADYPLKPNRTSKGWRLSVLQDQLRTPHALQMLVTLEKKPDPNVSLLQQIYPVQTWFELADPTSEFTQRWRRALGYPAPAWSLEVPEWPTDQARPKLSVWWSPDQRTPASIVLSRDHDFKKLDDLIGRTIQLPGGFVRIDGIDVKEHALEVRPGQRGKESCLVIRLSHSADQPYWPEVTGLSIAGQEQRFYTQIGKSTTLLWPVTQEQAEQGLRDLRFTSVVDFKSEAKRRGYFLEMDDLAPPEPGDLRPRPFVLKPAPTKLSMPRTLPELID